MLKYLFFRYFQMDNFFLKKELDFQISEDNRVDSLLNSEQPPGILNFINLDNENNIYFTTQLLELEYFDEKSAFASKNINLKNVKFIQEKDNLFLSKSINPNSLKGLNKYQEQAVLKILNDIHKELKINFIYTEDVKEANLIFLNTKTEQKICGIYLPSYKYKNIKLINKQNQINEYIKDIDYKGFIIFNDQLRCQNFSHYQPGDYAYYLILHEIGHFLGLEHPNSNNIFTNKKYSLPLNQDHMDNTVMSYNLGPSQTYPSFFKEYDLAALHWIYGGDGIKNQFGYNSQKGFISVNSQKIKTIINENTPKWYQNNIFLNSLEIFLVLFLCFFIYKLIFFKKNT